jgi:hypothetical protein
MIKYAHEQFFLSANELVNSLQSKNSKSYWTFVKWMMKGTGNNYTIPPKNCSWAYLIILLTLFRCDLYFCRDWLDWFLLANLCNRLRVRIYFLISELIQGLSFKRMMKGTGNNYTIPPLYNGSTGELVYEDKAKADLLNQYFCSITSINDSNREPPNVEELFAGILNHIINFISLRFIFLQRLIRLISSS